MEGCLHTYHLKCLCVGETFICRSEREKPKCPLPLYLQNAGGSQEGGKSDPWPGSLLLIEPPVYCLALILSVKEEKHQLLIM